jgi:N-acetyltransferase
MGILKGDLVSIEPLAYLHADDLFTHCGADDDVWRWLPVETPRSVDEMRALIWRALAQRDAGERQPFAVIDNATGEAIGSTSFLDLSPEDRSLEIGWTFYGKAYWRTGINRETKLLLLEEAFDRLGCERVALKTDALNQRSRSAIEAIGAVYEGTLRHHRLRADGTWRDSVVYSILRDEWPQIRKRLEDRKR